MGPVNLNIHNEDINSIIFDCYGAIDYNEQVNIELSTSTEFGDGMIEINPLSLIRKLRGIKHIQRIIDTYFLFIVKRIPRLSDSNENLPIEDRFTKVYYKCYKKYSHSHSYGKYEYISMSLDAAIQFIKEENYAIQIPSRSL